MAQRLIVLTMAAFALGLAPGAEAGAGAPRHPCRAALPHGPAVPAPLVLWTSCGSFALDTSGAVSRLPRHWLAVHGGGTGRRWQAQINVRRNRSGRVFLLEQGRTVWRSNGLYRNDGGTIEFGPRAFAFASYRRGVFITDLVHPERLIAPGKGLAPYRFNRAGQLLVTGGGTLRLLAPDGTVLRRIHPRARNGYGYDERTDTLYYVTESGDLAAAKGARVRLLRSVAQIDGTISLGEPGLLVFSGGHSITVTRRDGRLVARARWRSTRLSSDSGVAVAPDGRAFAFRLSDVHAGSRTGSAAVYVLRSGEREAQVVYSHRLGASGCAYGAALGWNGRDLLYGSSDGTTVLIDTRTNAGRDLTRLAHSLPRLAAGERAHTAWRSDFRR
jgi:hypothetical protein